MSDGKSVVVLNRLIQVCRDGERGFQIAAQSVRNRGLKVLLKSYAQQRAQFAAQLQDQVTGLGAQPRQGGSFLAGLHRGLIDIRAALTIGAHSREDVALSESLRGESMAMRRYQAALNDSLPEEIKRLVQEQYDEIQEVTALLEQMRGGAGKRMVVRLFDQDQDAEQAISMLHEDGFTDAAIHKVNIGGVIEVYTSDQGRSAAESAGAGALGGLVIGAFLGLLIGLGSLVIPDLDMGVMLPTAVLAMIVAGAGVGAVFGAIFGILIGVGVIEEDAYLYAESVDRGDVLLTVETTSDRARQASEIMLAVNSQIRRG